ncbi:COMM domain-containing protein 4 [Onthophagus taurus]|uniref:COMM domain-containing protein 4 n=1 Tax=Onthophagus taurus TaxID=166361 RepID=UPI000C2024B7|nr:COMM domain-containing protein 4 [Onthophagus taurus]
MRFRFCGDADCPDWVLAEINMLSKLSSVKLKSLTQVVAQGIISPPIDIEKAEQIFTDSKLDEAIDLKACIACLGFILTSTIKFNCDHNALHSELQQLGLPREHSTSIKRVTSENCLDIATKLKGSSLKINPLQNFMLHINEKSNLVHFNMSINDKSTTVVMTPYTSDILLENLKGIRESMKEMIDDPYNI